MLLYFKTKNYKSIKDEIKLSMVPAPRQTGLDYSILEETIKSKKYKALSTAVIYGPNASGKTNIISSMEVLQKIISRGHIKNNKENSPNHAVSFLELIPNKDNTGKDLVPVEFEIKFTSNNHVFMYTLSIDLGGFLDKEYNRKIAHEALHINEKCVFVRDKNIEILDGNYLNDELNKSSLKTMLSIMNSNIIENELFLTNGFKQISDSKTYRTIIEWFENSFEPICRTDLINVEKNMEEEGKLSLESRFTDFINELGVDTKLFGYKKRNKESNEGALVSLLPQTLEEAGNIGIDAKIFESYGTYRLLNILPLIEETLINGRVLIVDEFDASMHPMLIASFINVFHNDDINKKNAQLIFNTHNPMFLNSNLFRRDEIKFVDYDEDNNTSVHYSLSDFGSKDVRKSSDYMKNYFVNHYGAIRDIDFSNYFMKLMEANDGEKE